MITKIKKKKNRLKFNYCPTIFVHSYGRSCMRATLPKKKTKNISYHITIYNSRIITYWMTLVSSEIYTRYVDKTYNRTNVDFFPSIIVWPTIKMTGLRWIYIYLTQTTIVSSLANLALIGNVKILSVAPNITFQKIID